MIISEKQIVQLIEIAKDFMMQLDIKSKRKMDITKLLLEIQLQQFKELNAIE